MERSDWPTGSRGKLHFGVDAGPVLLGKCIHFTVESSKAMV